MSPLVFPKWTVVQHSGYGYKGDPRFEHAVEERVLVNNGELSRVRQADGLLFDTYMEAEEFTEKANYPEDHPGGLIPAANGTFSELKIDGLCIYIPVRTVEG